MKKIADGHMSESFIDQIHLVYSWGKITSNIIKGLTRKWVFIAFICTDQLNFHLGLGEGPLKGQRGTLLGGVSMFQIII